MGEEESKKKNESEMSNLTSKLKKDMMGYLNTLKADQKKSRSKMQKRLAARKAKRKLEIQEKHEKQKANELKHQQEEMYTLKIKQSKMKEAEALQTILTRALEDNEEGAEISQDKIGSAIEIVMRDRHTQEQSELVARQFSERSDMMRSQLEDLFESKRGAKARRLVQLKEENPSILQEEIESALKNIDNIYDQKRKQIESEACSEIDQRHAKEQLDLRAKQLEEVLAMFRELAPEEVIAEYERKTAERQAEELKRFQEHMNKDKNDRINKIRKQKAELESKLRLESEEELRKIEEEHESRLRSEREKADLQLEQRRQKLLEEQRKQQAEALKKMSQDEAQDASQRQAIMQAFNRDRQNVVDTMMAERAGQHQVLENKLRARRERRARKAKEKLQLDNEKVEVNKQRQINLVTQKTNAAVESQKNFANIALSIAMHKKVGGTQAENGAIDERMLIARRLGRKWKQKASLRK